MEPELLAILRQCPREQMFIPAGGRGTPFTLKVRDAGRGLAVEFIRANGTSKSVSADRLVRFWMLWKSGIRDLSQYRNETGKCTKAAAASYALPVFEWIEAR